MDTKFLVAIALGVVGLVLSVYLSARAAAARVQSEYDKAMANHLTAARIAELTRHEQIRDLLVQILVAVTKGEGNHRERKGND